MITISKVTTALTPAAAALDVTMDKPVAIKKIAVRAKMVKAAKPTIANPVPLAVKARPATVAKPDKAKKPKLVRDSFTIPKAEYTVLDDLKLRSIALAQPIKKSELLRAGIKALAAMSDAAFQSALKAVPTIKTGRPAANVAPEPAAKKAVKKLVKKT